MLEKTERSSSVSLPRKITVVECSNPRHSPKTWTGAGVGLIYLSHLENDQLSGSPDMCSTTEPLYLIPHHTVYEEGEEDKINDESCLHDPHGNSVDVLQGRGLAGVVRG